MQSSKPKFWTIGGGKGGVGKSILTASMGVALARMGRSVIAVDADLGAANLHTYLGVANPGHTLQDILENRATRDQVLLETSERGLRMISCASDIIGMANPLAVQKDRIIEFISTLDAEYILVDLGAGTSYNVLDFFNMADEGIAVVSPDPASMQNAYAFIKSAVFRKIQRRFGTNEAVIHGLKQFREGASQGRTMMDFYELLSTSDAEAAERVAAVVDGYRPLLVVNMATSEADQRVADIIQNAAQKFLNVSVRFCGLIHSDPAVRRAGQRMAPLNFDDPDCLPAAQIRQTVLRLLNTTPYSQTPERVAWEKPAAPAPIMGLNDNIDFMGRQLHVQTEDLGPTARAITTQVFSGGQIILSTKTEYPAALQPDSDRNLVLELMRKQHFDAMREIEGRKSGMVRPA